MSLSKKSNEIIQLCCETRSYIEETKTKDEEIANRMIAKLLEAVSKGTKCEVDINEVLEAYWKMKDVSTQSYRYMH